MADSKRHSSAVANADKNRKTMARNKADFGDIIRNARIAQGLSQAKVGELLGISTVQVCNMEVGRTKPDLRSIPSLCEILHISIAELFGVPNDIYALDDSDRRHIDTMHSLDQRNQQAVRIMAESLLKAQRLDLWNRCRNDFIRKPVSSLAASAGTGFELDEGHVESMLTLRTCPSVIEADLIIPVCGDSMEPAFFNGDRLLVSFTSELKDGQIGILVINGEGFVKQYFHDGVRSYNNAKYPFRKFVPGDEVRVIGRVIGKVENNMLPNRQERAILYEIEQETEDI